MELRQLRYFIAVAEQLSFTRAAELLHVSQPPLSRQITNLEDELGVRLLNRNKHRVAITDAGRLFLIHAKDVVEGMETAAMMARQVAEGEIGSLVVGYGGVVSYTVVPSIIKNFRKRSPGVKISLEPIRLMDHVDAVRSRRVDVGFVQLPCDDKALATELIMRDVLVAAVPTEHALASRKSVSLEELAACDFICFPRTRNANYYRHFMELCKGAGFIPNIVREVAPMESLIALVAAGMGIAIVPSSAGKLGSDDMCFIRIRDAEAFIEYGFAWNRDNTSPVLKAFLASAKPLIRDGSRSRQAPKKRAPAGS